MCANRTSYDEAITYFALRTPTYGPAYEHLEVIKAEVARLRKELGRKVDDETEFYASGVGNDGL